MALEGSVDAIFFFFFCSHSLEQGRGVAGEVGSFLQ